MLNIAICDDDIQITGTIENFGLDTVEHAGIQLSGIQPYGIRLFRVVGGIETGNPFA